MGDFPLPLPEWIAAAERLGLIMTLADFYALPEGVAVRIAPLDTVALTLLEYSSRIPGAPQPHAVYSPEDFFAPLANTFSRIPDPLENDQCCGILGGVMGVEPYAEAVYGDGRYAATGLGDSYTRYIAWAHLNSAPPVYFQP